MIKMVSGNTEIVFPDFSCTHGICAYNVYSRHLLWYKFHSLHSCWLNHCYPRLYDFAFSLGVWHDSSTFLDVERIQECQGKANLLYLVLRPFIFL